MATVKARIESGYTPETSEACGSKTRSLEAGREQVRSAIEQALCAAGIAAEVTLRNEDMTGTVVIATDEENGDAVCSAIRGLPGIQESWVENPDDPTIGLMGIECDIDPDALL